MCHVDGRIHGSSEYHILTEKRARLNSVPRAYKTEAESASALLDRLAINTA